MMPEKVLSFMAKGCVIVGAYDIASAQFQWPLCRTDAPNVLVGVALCMLGGTLFAYLVWLRRK